MKKSLIFLSTIMFLIIISSKVKAQTNENSWSQIAANLIIALP